MLPPLKSRWYRRRKSNTPDGLLRNIIKEVISDVRIVKAPKERGINHVESRKGTNTDTAAAFATSMNTSVSAAWKTGGPLLAIALKAHIKDRHSKTPIKVQELYHL